MTLFGRLSLAAGLLLVGGCGRAPEAQVRRKAAAPAPVVVAGPPETPAQPAALPLAENYELTAIMAIGGKTTVLISDLIDKTARWMDVGDRTGNLELVSCDTEKFTAVLKVFGEPKLLKLKQSMVLTVGSTSGPLSLVGNGAGGAQPSSTEGPPRDLSAEGIENEKQAREARMFVSDILEIGIQQRRAYEEKQAAEVAKVIDAAP